MMPSGLPMSMIVRASCRCRRERAWVGGVLVVVHACKPVGLRLSRRLHADGKSALLGRIGANRRDLRGTVAEIGSTDEARPGRPASADTQHPESGSTGHRPGAESARKLQVHLFSQLEEVDALLPLIAEGHAEGPFGRYAFSEKKARRRVLGVLENRDRRAGFYVTYRGRVVGLADVAVGPHYLSDDGLVATCLALLVAADIRKSLLGVRAAAHLMRAIKSWARAKGANMLTIHGTGGSVRRMARGARAIGINVAVPLRG